MTYSTRKAKMKNTPNKVIPIPDAPFQQGGLQNQRTIYRTTLKKKTPAHARRKMFGIIFMFTFIGLTVSAAFIIFCILGSIWPTTEDTTSTEQSSSYSTVHLDETTTTETESKDQSKCNFEDEIACGYRTNSMEWIIDHGSNTTTPQHDHTLKSTLGHFVRMNNKCLHCRRRMLMSPWEEFKDTSCLRFYYFLAGRKQVSLSVRIRWDGVRRWTALRIPGSYRRYAWSVAQVPLNIQGRAIFEFIAALSGAADDIFMAIDDVQILYSSCPPLDCEIGEIACPNGEICLANFLYCDGVPDCPDGADEINCYTNTSHIRLSDLLQLPGQGRLEMRTDNEWRPLCGAKWTGIEASVACRMLGYTKVENTWLQTVKTESALYSVQCSGNEASLLQCHTCLANAASPNCTCQNSKNQVSISCSGVDNT